MSGVRKALAAASLALCLGGAALATRGALVPVEAGAAQVRLNREFDQALAKAAPASKPAQVQIADTPARRSFVPVAGLRRPRPAEARPELAEPAVPPAAAPGTPLARLTIARLHVRDVILAGPVTHDDLDKGPMMVKRGDAASPVTVLAAHRDTHFLFVRDLREGDVVTLQYVTGAVEHYRVRRFETVRWDRFAYPLDPARPLLALTTCYPFGGTEYGGPLRRVAWAERVG